MNRARYLIDAITEFVEAGFERRFVQYDGNVLIKRVTRHKVSNLDELNALFED